MAHNVSERGTGQSGPDGAGSSEDSQQAKNNLGRRTLLTRGGAVAAGVVGASTVGGLVAGPAGAQTAQPVTAVLMNTANNAGAADTQATELDADNPTLPAFILNNTGIDTSNSNSLAGPSIRLTPSAATGVGPTASTAGGDLTATSDGELWFTHDLSNESLPAGVSPIQPAPVHTELNSNVFAVLPEPVRLLDTRSASLRTNILNPSVLLSSGQVPSKTTIYLNLDNQVIYADTIFANVTVTSTTASGFLTLWSGFISGAANPTAPPTTSNINWTAAGVTLANFAAVGTGVYPVDSATPTNNNVIAIYADTTTHVILDAIAFTMPGFEFLQPSVGSTTAEKSLRAARLSRAQAAVRAAKSNTSKS